MNHRESRQDILLRHNQLLKQCESYYQNKINEILTEKTQTLLRLSAQLYDKLKAHDDQTNTGSGFVFSSNVTMPSCASPTMMSNHSAKSTFPLAPNTVGANPVNSGISPLGPIPPLPPIPNFKLQPECHDVTLLIQEALLSMDDQQNTQSTAAAANDSTTNNAKDCLSESMDGALRSIFPVRNDGGNNGNYVVKKRRSSDGSIASNDPSSSTIQLRYNSTVNTKESASSQVPHQYEPATSSTSPTKATLRRRTKPKKGNPMNPILLPPRIDGDQVKWPCSHCNIEYYASDDLVNHLSSIHSKRDNQKGFICPMKKCGKSLKSRNNLKRHIRTHTGFRFRIEYIL